MARRALVYIVLFVLFAVSCTYQEPRIRSEPLLRFPAHLAVTSESVSQRAGMPSLEFHCSEWNPWSTRLYDSMSSSFTGGSSALNECIYVSIDVSSLAPAIAGEDPDTQDNIIRQLMYWSDYNCNNFRARVFSLRSNVTYVGAVTSGLLASSGAITALVAGPVAAALSGASAAVTSAITPINNSYYADYTMGKLDELIVQERADMKHCIEQRMAGARPTPTPSAAQPTRTRSVGADNGTPDPAPTPTPVSAAANCPIPSTYPWPAKISDLQIYDSMCSLEILAANPMASVAPTPTPQPTPVSTPTIPSATATAPHGAPGGGGARRQRRG
jgi:hypothetical protein